MMRFQTMIVSFLRSRHGWLKAGIAAAVLVILIGGALFLRPVKDQEPVAPKGGIISPVFNLPSQTEGILNATMLGMIYYNGKVYTQTYTEIPPEQAINLRGKKLGTAKGNLNGWKQQGKKDTNLASTVDKADVYAVKGYNKNFRIMTYSEEHSYVQTAFYECTGGLPLSEGRDFFKPFKMAGNVVSAQYQSYSEWRTGIDQLHPVPDLELINTLVDQLYDARLSVHEGMDGQLGDYDNDERYRRITIHLKDGTEVTLIIIKGGYIDYGFARMYFQIDNEFATQLWDALSPI
ncbi:hypothetical protein [Paenibacillus sp. FSL H8-0259]|uniref:hypothetical protein n=1 Tax=Paenibacillus sp. FSL H8-0259 TaxID=1920423 RepID=UPI00117D570D|nr:hypothetical protein [Paenibacillus sp. FSL H8-0259]